MTQETVSQRIAAQEARTAAVEAAVNLARDRADNALTEAAELRELITSARAIINRLESYERDMQWLRDERRKAR